MENSEKKIIKQNLDKFVSGNFKELIKRICRNTSYFYMNNCTGDKARGLIIQTYIHLAQKVNEKKISKVFNKDNNEEKIKFFLRTSKNLIIDRHRKNKISNIESPEEEFEKIVLEKEPLLNEKASENLITDDEDSLFIKFFVFLEDIKDDFMEKRRLKSIFSDQYKFHIQKFILNPDYYLQLNFAERYVLKKRIRSLLRMKIETIFDE